MRALLLSCVMLCLVLRSCLAAPQSHDDLTRNVGWVSDPNGRGTSSLIVTCLVTLGLCVWLSIPRRDETTFRHSLQYIKWSIIGIFGPELVVFAAWRQYISAQSLLREVRHQQAQELSSRPAKVLSILDNMEHLLTRF